MDWILNWQLIINWLIVNISTSQSLWKEQKSNIHSQGSSSNSLSITLCTIDSMYVCMFVCKRRTHLTKALILKNLLSVETIVKVTKVTESVYSVWVCESVTCLVHWAVVKESEQVVKEEAKGDGDIIGLKTLQSNSRLISLPRGFPLFLLRTHLSPVVAPRLRACQFAVGSPRGHQSTAGSWRQGRGCSSSSVFHVSLICKRVVFFFNSALARALARQVNVHMRALCLSPLPSPVHTRTQACTLLTLH